MKHYNAMAAVLEVCSMEYATMEIKRLTCDGSALQGYTTNEARCGGNHAEVLAQLDLIAKHVEACRVHFLVEAVKRHAFKHYSEGWDVVVESWTDEAIAIQIAGAKTAHGAICKLAPGIKLRHAYAEDIRAA